MRGRDNVLEIASFLMYLLAKLIVSIDVRTARCSVVVRTYGTKDKTRNEVYYTVYASAI